MTKNEAGFEITAAGQVRVPVAETSEFRYHYPDDLVLTVSEECKIPELKKVSDLKSDEWILDTGPLQGPSNPDLIEVTLDNQQGTKMVPFDAQVIATRPGELPMVKLACDVQPGEVVVANSIRDIPPVLVDAQQFKIIGVPLLKGGFKKVLPTDQVICTKIGGLPEIKQADQLSGEDFVLDVTLEQMHPEEKDRMLKEFDLRKNLPKAPVGEIGGDLDTRNLNTLEKSLEKALEGFEGDVGVKALEALKKVRHNIRRKKIKSWIRRFWFFVFLCVVATGAYFYVLQNYKKVPHSMYRTCTVKFGEGAITGTREFLYISHSLFGWEVIDKSSMDSTTRITLTGDKMTILGLDDQRKKFWRVNTTNGDRGNPIVKPANEYIFLGDKGEAMITSDAFCP